MKKPGKSMEKITDCHTHAFPDWLAPGAMQALCEELDPDDPLPAFHDGTVGGLQKSMENAGIERALICSIATKVKQYQAILDWSLAVQSDTIIPLASVHPDDPEREGRIYEIRDKGLKGFKLHPYYQGFDLLDERMIPVFRALEDTGLILVCHTGFDIAFPDRKRLADARRILQLKERWPDLVFIAGHFGGWDDWDEAEAHLIGEPVYLELSFILQMLPRKRVEQLLLAHPEEYLLFGTDSPWTDQKETVDRLAELKIPERLRDAILWKNAGRLLAD